MQHQKRKRQDKKNIASGSVKEIREVMLTLMEMGDILWMELTRGEQQYLPVGKGERKHAVLFLL